MKLKKPVYFLLSFILLLILLYTIMWFSSLKRYPLEFGLSFSQTHAMYLGLNWQETYSAMLIDLKPKYARIAAMWSEVEKESGKYDFSAVDWMMGEAEKNNVKVALVVGQKAPRWPECHVPNWANELSPAEYKKSLLDYVRAIIERYKNSSALELWQIENEPFIEFRFGDCKAFQIGAVYEEIQIARALDSVHKTMITDSGELSWWRDASRAGDIFATTIYRVVRTPRGTIFTYDWLPPAFYRWKAKFNGLKMDAFYISELQAEPWFTNGDALNTPLEMQKETAGIERIKSNLDFASRVGVKRAYLWGVEWWYWMKTKMGDKSYWNFIQTELSK